VLAYNLGNLLAAAGRAEVELEEWVADDRGANEKRFNKVVYRTGGRVLRFLAFKKSRFSVVNAFRANSPNAGSNDVLMSKITMRASELMRFVLQTVSNVQAS
jgi:hypothetical protein